MSSQFQKTCAPLPNRLSGSSEADVATQRGRSGDTKHRTFLHFCRKKQLAARSFSKPSRSARVSFRNAALVQVQLGLEVRSVIGTADERAAGDMAEALGLSHRLPLCELLGSDVLDHWQVHRSGAEILPKG